MPIPEFVSELRELVGKRELWLPGVTAVVLREQEVLLVRRVDNGLWAPVTGIVDPREHPAVAARREVLEETGVEARVDRLAWTGVIGPVTYDNGDLASYLDLTFACAWVAGEAYVADDESLDVGWFDLDDLPEMPDDMRTRVLAGISEEERAQFSV